MNAHLHDFENNNIQLNKGFIKNVSTEALTIEIGP